MPFDIRAALNPLFRSLHRLARPPRSRRRALVAALTVAAGVLLPAAGGRAATTYRNPFTGDQAYIGRTDMGVDLCLSPGEPIRAIGDGVVTGIDRNWFEGEPYVWYQLSDGPDAGRYVYVAEQIRVAVRVGQVLKAGDVIAHCVRKGTCIETGWGVADGETLAQATTGYTEGEVTTAGISFAHFLISLGVPGDFELVAPVSQTARSHRKHRKHVHSHPIVPTTPVAPATS